MAIEYRPNKGQAYSFTVGLYSYNNTNLLARMGFISTNNVLIRKDLGNWNTLTNTPTVSINGVAIDIALSADEMMADRITLFISDAGSSFKEVLLEIRTRDTSIRNLHFEMLTTAGTPAPNKSVSIKYIKDADTVFTNASNLTTVTEIGEGMYNLNMPIQEVNVVDCITVIATATDCIPRVLTLPSIL